MDFLLISVLGLIGIFLRYSFTTSLNQFYESSISLLIVNCLGCLILGGLYSCKSHLLLSDKWMTILSVGFCGALTTFSSYQLHLWLKLEQNEYRSFLILFILIPVAGLLSIWLGRFISSKIIYFLS